MHLAQITHLNNPGNSQIFNFYDNFLARLVGRVLIFGLLIAGFIFLIRVIAAGFALMTAAGDPGKIQSATKGLINGLIGLVVAVTAFLIAQVIQTVFGLSLL